MNDDPAIRLDHTIYTPSSIASGVVEFAPFCQLAAQTDGESTVLTVVRNDNAPEETIDELLNYILNAALEERLGS